MNNILEENQKDIYDRYYNKNETIDSIAKSYKLKRYHLNYFFDKKGWKRKSISESKRKYTLDEHYFDEINTPNKAYILGLLYADGYNNTLIKNVVLSLSIKDKDFLEKIKQELKSNKPLNIYEYDQENRKYHSKPIAVMNLSSKHMSETLENKGMIQNKSLVLEFPNWLREDLKPHFIRGYFDGDGCVNISKKYLRINFSIMSSKNFCEDMQRYLLKNGIVTYVNAHCGAKKETRVLRVSKKDTVKQLYNLMYKDATLYLERKFIIFKKFFND